MDKRHRIFIAINLPEEIKKELERHQQKLQEKFSQVHPHTNLNDELGIIESESEAASPDDGAISKLSKKIGVGASWTKKDNLHITLEFLGYLTDQELGEVCLIVKEVTGRHGCFSLNLKQVLYGPPSRGRSSLRRGEGPQKLPKFVWAGGEKSKELSSLKEDLENSLTEKVRFVPEERTFAPHITLARINAWAWKGIEPEERPEINEEVDLVFTVESIDVMESVLKRGGPVYTILESHQLGE